MARREDVFNSIYDDLDHLSNDALSVYMWSWCNKTCGMAGIYKIPKRLIYHARLAGAELDEALGELAEDGKLFYERGVLWNKGRIGRLSAITKQIGKSIAKDLNDLDDDHPLRARCIDRYSDRTDWIEHVEPHLRVARGSSEPRNAPSGREKVNLNRTSTEVQPNLRGRGSGSGSGSGSREEGSGGKGEFDEWLVHYRKVTGRVSVQGSESARKAFKARRSTYSLEDLKLATVGCQSDSWRVEKGHNVPDTILRASNVEGYISQAKDTPNRPPASAPGMTQAEKRAEQIRRKRETRAAA